MGKGVGGRIIMKRNISLFAITIIFVITILIINIYFYADKKDLFICISSSGMSKNIILGAKQAKKIGCNVITFSGFEKNNKLKKIGNLNFWVNSKNYNIVEMTHHIWLLAAMDMEIAMKNHGIPVNSE